MIDYDAPYYLLIKAVVAVNYKIHGYSLYYEQK